MLIHSFKKTTCAALLLLSGALSVASQALSATIENRAVVKLNAETVDIYRDAQGLRVVTSEGKLFSINVQNEKQLVVNINGVRQIYPVEQLEQGSIRFSDAFLVEYRNLVESELGDLTHIPEDPDVLFSVSFWEAVGCSAAGFGATVGTNQPWVGAGVLATCLAYWDDHSVELD